MARKNFLVETAREFPAEHRALSSIGGLTTQAKYGSKVIERARQGRINRWLAIIDPDGAMTPEEREEGLRLMWSAWHKRMFLAQQRAQRTRRMLNSTNQ